MRPFKCISLLFVLLLVGSIVSAQNQRRDDIDHELSFNTTFLLQNVFAIVPNENDLAPYIVQYKRYHHEKRIAWRSGIGLNLEFEDSKATSQVTRRTSSSNIRIRTGLEKRIPASDKLDFIIGADIFGQYAYEKVITFVSPNTDTRENEIATGVSPVFGLSLKLGQNASINFESAFSLYYQYRKSETDTRDGAPPTIFENRSFSTTLDQPYGIYLGIKF
jgi:hypothetical protein